MPVDWVAVREEFAALNQWTYLNTATLGLIPRREKAAIEAHYIRREEFGQTDFDVWWSDLDDLRSSIGQLIGATSADIAFFPNSCSVLALAASAIEWRDGDEILTLADEFPNQFYFAAARAKLVEVPMDQFYEAVNPRTRMVAISSVNYQTGLRAPYEEIGKFLRERDIFFYLDATQSVGALRMNVTASQASIVAVNCYKWMISPPGAAFAFVDAKVRAKLRPSVIGWRSDAGWRDMHDLSNAPPEFSSAAEKYEGGMLAFSPLYAMKSAVDWMLEIGPEHIENRVLDLARLAASVIRNAGGHVNYEGSSIVAAQLPGLDVTELARKLRNQKIVVSARGGNLRISPHFYNSTEDIDRLANALPR